MAMFGPAAQAAMQERQNFMAVGQRPSSGSALGNFLGPIMFGRAAIPILAMLRQSGTSMNQRGQYRGARLGDGNARTMGNAWNSSSPATVIQAGPTQVIRPSAQAPQRRAAAPQAGASSSLITSTPSPAEVALATTTLLGG